MNAGVTLRPGLATLADWRDIYRGASLTLDPICRADVEAGAAALQAMLAADPSWPGFNDREPGPTVVELLNKGGEPLPAALVRLAAALKLASLAQGLTGASWHLIETLEGCLAHDLLPSVPAANASDRLAFAHLASVLTGAGEVASGGKPRPAAKALKTAGLAPVRMNDAERGAIISGTELSTALALAGLFEAERVFQSGIVAGALSARRAGVVGISVHPRVARLHRHPGEIEVAAALGWLLRGGNPTRTGEGAAPAQPGDFRRNHARMGACLDLLRQAGATLERQANAVTERRLVLWQTAEVAEAVEDTSALVLAADLIAIALREIGAVSEERIVAAAGQSAGSGDEHAPALSAGPAAMAAGFVAENRERAGGGGLNGHANGEQRGGAPDGIRRLLPMAGTAALVVAIEVLAARPVEDDPAGGAGSPLEGASELLRGSLLGSGRESQLGAADLPTAAELVTSGALAAAASIPLPTVLPTPAGVRRGI